MSCDVCKLNVCCGFTSSLSAYKLQHRQTSAPVQWPPQNLCLGPLQALAFMLFKM